MSNRKEVIYKKTFYPECKATISKNGLLSEMRRRRDSIRKMIEHADAELEELKSAESLLTVKITNIETQIKKGEF